MKTTEKREVKKMKRAEVKNFTNPDEVREFPKGRLELVKVGGATVAHVVLEPGWKWSESVKPIAKTKSCQAPHLQYFLSGVLKVRMDDGSEFECHAGDVALIPPGHDAWVIGEVPVAAVDFQGMLDYAKSK